MSEVSAGPGESTASPGCPVAHWFDPNDAASHPDPFPWYRQLREEGPVVFVPSIGMYAVSRHRDVLEILRDTTTYSNVEGLGEFRPLPATVREEVGEDWAFPDISESGLTVMDPPKHTRLRKVVAPALTPRRMATHAAMIREVVDARIDEFAEDGRADLASQFAYRIPSTVIGRIIGATDDESDRFVPWVEAFFTLRLATLPEEEEIRLWRLLVEYDRCVRDLIEDRRRNPQDDLTTDLINAQGEEGEPKLTDEQIVGLTTGWIGAGAETSSVMIVNILQLLLSHQEQWEEVRSDPSLVPRAVEEGLRLRSPIRGIVRVVTKDTELGGVHIPKDARVYWVMASANHDEETFGEDSAAYDIHRANRDEHLSFGKWAHFCIGAPLARMEGRIAVEALAERLPNLRLARDYERDFGYENNLVLPPVKALRVEWD